MSITPRAMSERPRTKLTWTLLGLTVAAWIAAMAIRVARPVIEPVMDASQQAVDGAFNAALLVFAVMGALVAVRQPRNPIGWLLFAMGVFKVVGFIALEYAIHALFWKPGSCNGARWPPGCGTSSTSRSFWLSRSSCCCFPMAACPHRAGGGSP